MTRLEASWFVVGVVRILVVAWVFEVACQMYWFLTGE